MAGPKQSADVTTGETGIRRPEARGRGLGSALLDTCLRECDAEEFDTVILWPTPPRRTLYQRHDFVAHGGLMQR